MPPLQNWIHFISLLFTYLLISNSKGDSENNIIIPIKEQMSSFINELLISHLESCYVVHLQNENKITGLNMQVQSIPSIEINSEQLSPTFFNNFDKIHISRHGKQCKVYLIESDNMEILKIFSNPSLQIQVHQSYLIFFGQTEPTVEEMIFSPHLQNYKNRIWLETTPTSAPELRIRHHYFCYTCGVKANPALIETTSNPIAFQTSLANLFPDVTKNLNGKPLICTAPQAPPLVAIIPKSKNKCTNNEFLIVGMQAIILSEMAKKMNFTFVLKPATDGATGIPLTNGTWTGIMGEILSKEADIGLSVATSYERNKILEFTVPVFHAFLVLVAVKPMPHFAWEAIFYPFNHAAWVAILVSTFVTVVCYKYLHNLSTRKKSERISFFKSAYMAIGALLEQGIPLKFITTPSRIHAGFWFLFAIVVTCAYRSKLFMFLTFPTIEKPPLTLQELSVSDYTWGMKSLGGVGLLLITKSPLTYSRKIGEKLELSFDKYSCLDKTFTHRFVCIIYRAYIDYMSVVRYWKVNHKFQISDYVTTSVGSSWVLPKYSPLLPVLDEYHFRQFEMGLANKYVEKYQEAVAIEARASAQISNSTEDTFAINTNYVREVDGPKPLRLGNMGGAFFILLFGLGLGGTVFLVEILQNYYKRTVVIKMTKRKKIQKCAINRRRMRVMKK